MQRDDAADRESTAEPAAGHTFGADAAPRSDAASTAGSGAGDGFDAFYAATARRMVAAVYALTGNLADAEDAVHEAYARAWARWAQVQAGGDPSAWVRTVAQRLAVSTWRKARNRMRAHLRHGAPDALPEMSPDHVALVAALQKLPKDQRRVIVLFHLYDLSAQAVALELGCSEGAVRTRLYRARMALAGHLGEPGEARPVPTAL
jgi:RNA polymerase sigma-70 factor (ECF subfamily)